MTEETPRKAPERTEREETAGEQPSEAAVSSRRRPRRVAAGRRGRATRKRDPSSPCLNCGDPGSGRYCPNCGQRKIDVLVSVRVMLADELEDEFVLNRRLPRTLFALFFQPGLLTVEYINGRIASYARPLKLYLVSSVVFFLLLSFFTLRLLASADLDRERGVIEMEPADVAAIESVQGGPSGEDSGETARPRERAPTIGELVNLEAAREEGRFLVRTGVEAVDSVLVRRVWYVADMTPRQAAERLVGAFLQYVPMAMFVLLPMFALVLKLLYVRRHRYYAEHFIFLLHVHAFIYLIYAIMLLTRGLFSLPGWLGAALFGWTAIYVLLAMKRVYAQSWGTTFVKYVALGFTYTAILAVSVPVVLFVSFLLF